MTHIIATSVAFPKIGRVGFGSVALSVDMFLFEYSAKMFKEWDFLTKNPVTATPGDREHRSRIILLAVVCTVSRLKALPGGAMCHILSKPGRYHTSVHPCCILRRVSVVLSVRVQSCDRRSLYGGRDETDVREGP